MSNRYSALNRRPGAATSSLFADYPGSRPSPNSSQTRLPSSNPESNTNRTPSPYYTQQPTDFSTPDQSSSPLFNSYPNTNSTSTKSKPPASSSPYTSTALLDHLEAQNENAQTSLLSSKVSQLKQLSIAIGDEIRDSSSLAQTINDSFENTSTKLKGTMKRMLRMADRTGVGWKVWLGFFAVVWLLFVYVWLF